MDSNRKICWVTDHLHGTITLSSLEKQLISTPEYNRLHNVLQDSTVYLTYPSNRTSRFIHSIGTAHVVSEMFRSSILNASSDTLGEFWVQFEKEIEKLQTEEDFCNDVAGLDFERSGAELRSNSLEESFQDPFYLSEVPSKLSLDKEKYAFVILQQSLRFAALLHDVGHPPFSHVSENALGDIYSRLQRASNNLNEKEKALYELLKPIRESKQQSGKQKTNERAFHEALGLDLAKHLLTNLTKTNPRKTTNKALFDTLRIKHVTLNILGNKNEYYEALHEIVAGDIDADRIDYVLRDSVMSGIASGGFSMERLLKSYQLIHFKEEAKNLETGACVSETVFEFVPSVRALGVIEDFFKRRYNLYKQVIYHHRVVKFDALLQECVTELANDYLCSTVKDEEKAAKFLLPHDISGLWQVLKKDVGLFSSDRINCYIQWDDAWLLSALRQRYMQFKDCYPKNPKEQILFAKLEELLSNKKYYFSLFKRVDGFMEIENAFIENFDAHFKWDEFIGTLEDLAKTEINHVRSVITQRLFPGNRFDDHQAQKNGFLLTSLFKALGHGGGKTWGKDGLEIAERALQELKNSEGFLDVLLIRKVIKIGIKNRQKLVTTNHQIIKLEKASILATELEEASRFFPPFFIFIYQNSANDVSEAKLSQYRKAYGKKMSELFCREVKRRSRVIDLNLPR